MLRHQRIRGHPDAPWVVHAVRDRDPALIARLVEILQAQDWCGPIMTRTRAGAGDDRTLPTSVPYWASPPAADAPTPLPPRARDRDPPLPGPTPAPNPALPLAPPSPCRPHPPSLQHCLPLARPTSPTLPPLPP